VLIKFLGFDDGKFVSLRVKEVSRARDLRLVNLALLGKWRLRILL